MQHIIRGFKLLPKWKHKLAAILLINMGMATILIGIPLAVQRIIDTLYKSLTQEVNLVIGLVVPFTIWIALRLFGSIANWLMEIVADNVFRDVAMHFRLYCVGKLERLDIAYYEKRRAGQIASEVNQSPWTFAEWLQSVAEDQLVLLLSALFAFGVLVYKFPPIALVILPIVALYIRVTYKTMQGNRPYGVKSRRLINEWTGIQTENISFVADIRALGIGKHRGELYRHSLLLHGKNLFNMFRYQHRRNFLAAMIEIALFAFPIAIFSYRAAQGQQNPSDIYLLAIYLGHVGNFSARVGRLSQKMALVNDTVGETLAILDNEDVVQDAENPRILGTIDEISFQNTSFAYGQNKRNAVSNISLRITKGTTVALVGRSGSGKSTLIKLLLRFYDPTEGTVEVNGISLTDYTQDDLRSKMGVVMQDVALFNDTIAGNIAIARPDATQAQIEHAAKLAHAHEFITSLPDGYETLVGERGVKLSGGEKQRVSIARAMLREPELVLLDEATSALDSESEKAVQAGLKKLLTDRTAVVIAHRLSTIAHADQIVVLDKGKIVQTGTYQELKAAKGLFADLLKHQEL